MLGETYVEHFMEREQKMSRKPQNVLDSRTKILRYHVVSAHQSGYDSNIASKTMMANFTDAIKDEGDVLVQRKEEEPLTDNVTRTRIEGIHWDEIKPRVTERFLVKISNTAKNTNQVLWGVIDTNVCHLLLGRPWESHQNSYYSYTNSTYSFLERCRKLLSNSLQDDFARGEGKIEMMKFHVQKHFSSLSKNEAKLL